jgi:NAD-dependent SIR2 family protein deacetylase
MAAHHASCQTCQREAATERMLRQRWQDLPSTPDCGALWPRIAQRIDGVPQRRRLPLFQALAMGSMVATACLLCIVSVRLHVATDPGVSNPAPPTIVSIDDSRIVQMASQIQESPEGESELFFAETQQDRHELHQVLSGGREK